MWKNLAGEWRRNPDSPIFKTSQYTEKRIEKTKEDLFNDFQSPYSEFHGENGGPKSDFEWPYWPSSEDSNNKDIITETEDEDKKSPHENLWNEDIDFRGVI